jgi:hypothetical protein
VASADEVSGTRRVTADDLRQSQRDGTARADVDADIVAQILVAVMDGLQVQWLYDQNMDMAAAIDLLLTTWLQPGPAATGQA